MDLLGVVVKHTIVILKAVQSAEGSRSRQGSGKFVILRVSFYSYIVARLANVINSFALMLGAGTALFPGSGDLIPGRRLLPVLRYQDARTR